MRRGLRYFVMLAAVVYCLRTTAVPCFAQEGQPSPRSPAYSFALIGVPLNEALYTLIEQTGIELFFESELVKGKTVHCRIENAPQEDVLGCILESSDLDYIKQSTGLYVVVPAPRRAPLYGSISGFVIDTETGEPLSRASIVMLDEATGTATNIAGRFAFDKMMPGLHRFSVSHVAYEPLVDTVRVAPSESKQLYINLQRRTVLAMPIVIQAPLHRRAEGSYDGYISSDMLQEPGVAPTPSTLAALNTIVGVHVGDALSDVHVQGGDAGEHQYLLDGAPVFVPLRNFGFFGSFSPFAIEQITVHKAGFEAKYGSFLSGAIDMTHDLVPDNSSLATVQIDPLSLNGRVHGFIQAPGRLQINWMTAGRLGLWQYIQPAPIDRSMRNWSAPNTFIYDALLQGSDPPAPPLALGGESPLAFNFSDIHAAARVRFPGAQSLYFSMYRGHNRFGLDDVAVENAEQKDLSEEAYDWYNQTGQLRYEWIQGKRTFLNAAIWQSDYQLRHPLDRDPFSALNPSGDAADSTATRDFDDILETGFKLAFDIYAESRHTISGDLTTTYTESEFNLSTDPFGQTPAIDHMNLQPARWLTSSYLQDAVSLSTRTQITAGSRFTYVYGQERLYAEPRISIDHEDLQGKWMLHAAAGLYRQFIDQFDVASYNLTSLLPSFRFWIPITRDSRAPMAYHFAGSVLYTPDPALDITLETYYKYQPRLSSLDYRLRLKPMDAPASTGLINARGYAYGAGLSVDYSRTLFRLQSHYEYTIARRKIADRFGGRYVSTPWETPHQVYAALDFTPWSRWTVTVRWQGNWGRRWGFRQAYYDYLEPDPDLSHISVFDFSDPESHRLPAFTQLDIGIAYTRRVGRADIQGRLSLLNVFDEKNTVEWILEKENGRPDAVLKTQESPPFFPSASLRIRI